MFIKLASEIVKRLRSNQINRLFGTGVMRSRRFLRDNWQCCGSQGVIVKHFATQNVLPAPSSPAQGRHQTHEEEIYSGPLSKKIRFLKIMTLTTSFGTLFLLKDIHNRIEFSNQAIMVAGVGVVILFSFLTPFLINLISKKYCVKMYYDHSKKQYIAHLYTLMFKKKKIVFTPDDVVVPKVNKFFVVAYVKNIPMFFDANHFKNVDYYKNIMGYDKPIDFRLDNKDEK